MSLQVRYDLFDRARGLDRGRSPAVEALWYLVKMAFFLTAFPWPSRWKRALLVAFGAKIGQGFVLRSRVNIHFPWKLVVGDHCWIGEEVSILNLEPVSLGTQCCVSQRTFLCTGNHDYKDHTMPYRNAPIRIDDGCWIAASVFVGPGVTIGEHCVVAAGSVVTKSLPPWSIARGNPAGVTQKRVLEK